MYEPQEMIKQMLSMNKSAFDNGYAAMMSLQEQNEKMLNSVLNQSGAVPAEGRKLLEDYMQAYKRGCEEFKRVVDENYARVDSYFNSSST